MENFVLPPSPCSSVDVIQASSAFFPGAADLAAAVVGVAALAHLVEAAVGHAAGHPPPLRQRG